MVQAAFKDKTFRRLDDLRGIGPAMLKDFELLGIRNVDQLATQKADVLYQRLNKLTGVRQDPCVLDTFVCAVEQARNANLPTAKKDWWYWSRIRLAEQRKKPRQR